MHQQWLPHESHVALKMCCGGVEEGGRGGVTGRSRSTSAALSPCPDSSPTALRDSTSARK